MDTPIAALIGATGGAGTTRSCLELATAMGAAGHDVAVLDAAYDTQGLASHLPGRLDPDMTTLVTDEADRPLSAGLVAFDAAEDPGGFDAVDDGAMEAPPVGRVVCCPAHAPFERLARAKRPAAAQQLERRIDEAAAAFDAVLLDTPPLGSNPAVAAVTAADRVAVVAPATARGHDAVQQTRGRLQDVGTNADAVVAVDRTDRDGFPDEDADVVIPRFEGKPPTGLESEAGVAALEKLAGAVVDDPMDLPIRERGLRDRIGSVRSA